jgi:S-formylglutathione hydrolase FrmB
MPDGDDDFYTDGLMPIDYAVCLARGEGLLDAREDRAHTCVRHRAYETYVLHDLIGHVDATYRTRADRASRGIAGLSMGGYGAFALALRHPDAFAAAASHSGVLSLRYGGPHPYRADKLVLADDIGALAAGMGPLGRWILGLFGTDLATVKAHDPASLIEALPPGAALPALYLDCGTEDDFGLDAGAAYVHDLLTARGVSHEFFLGPGPHDFPFWRDRVTHSLAFLRDHVAR